MKRSLAVAVVAVALGAVLWGPAGRLLSKLASTIVRSEHVRPDPSPRPTDFRSGTF